MSNSSPASYIHMVQHKIETCLIHKMSKEECIEAVSKNANINLIITSTVWEELVKENKEFFENYEQNNKHIKNEPMSEEDPMSEVEPMSEGEAMSEGKTNQMIQNIISGSPEN